MITRPNRRKKSSAAAQGVRIAALLLFGGIYLWHHYGRSSEPDLHAAPTTQTPAVEQPHTPTTAATSADLGLPRIEDNRTEQLVEHTALRISYNPEWRIANWVAYFLTPDRVAGDEPRANHFVPDPQTGQFSASDNDYRNSGYDRGHLAPAADMKWSREAMRESFYLSNIAPQNRNLNRGDWQELENQVRQWAAACDTLFVVCGPVVGELPETIGDGEVAVPDAFYKVLLRKADNQLLALGFLYPNHAGSYPIDHYAVAIDSIERITSIDFFYQLPPKEQHTLESQVDFSGWKE